MVETGLTVVSPNCQGLSDKLKRRDVFMYLRDKHYSIYCLQDTHFTPENEELIRNEWGYESYFNSYRSNARGVAIFLIKNLNLKYIGKRRIQQVIF